MNVIDEIQKRLTIESTDHGTNTDFYINIGTSVREMTPDGPDMYTIPCDLQAFCEVLLFKIMTQVIERDDDDVEITANALGIFEAMGFQRVHINFTKTMATYPNEELTYVYELDEIKALPLVADGKDPLIAGLLKTLNTLVDSTDKSPDSVDTILRTASAFSQTMTYVITYAAFLTIVKDNALTFKV